jgi:hypothetical protein
MALKTVDKVGSATMRKKRSIAKSRAASLKGWRTRERMKWARRLRPDQLLAEEFIEYIRPPELPKFNYMRALPNPWLDMK